MTRPISKRDISQALYAKAEQEARGLQEKLTPALQEAFKQVDAFHATYGIFPGSLGINLVPPELLAMLISADALAKPIKATAKPETPAEQETESPAKATTPRTARKARKARKTKRAPKHPSEKMLPIAQAKTYIAFALKSFKVGDKFKNADVYELALQAWQKEHAVDREVAKSRFPYKGLSLAMSTLKGVKRQKVQNAGSPRVVVYTASKKMYF